MAAVAIPDRSEVSQALAVILPPQHERFAVHVASGLSYRESARRAGFHEDNGFRLMQILAVRARVEELVSAPAERVRAGIEAEFQMLRNRMAVGDLDAEGRANLELRLKVVTAHARYLGLIVEKKQVSHASIDLGRPGPEDLQANLGQYLDVMEPGARRAIETRVKALDERRRSLKRALGPAVEAPAESPEGGC